MVAKRRANTASGSPVHAASGATVADWHGNWVDVDVAAIIAQAITAISAVAGARGAATNLSVREISAKVFQRPDVSSIIADAVCLNSEKGLSQWRVDFSEAEGRVLAEVSALLWQGGTQPERGTERRETARLGAAGGSGDASRDAPKRLHEPRTKGVAQDRIEQIMRGAYEVIAQKGFSGATTREIAEAAGMPIPTMYQYIRSKDELLPLIFGQLAGDLTAEFDQSISRSDDLTHALAASIIKYFDYCENNRRTINLIYRETANLNKNEREKIFQLDQSFVDVWELILERGRDQGQFNIENPRITAEMIYFLCTIWALRHWSLRAYPGEVVLRAIGQFVLRGVGVPDETVDRSFEKAGEE